MTLLCCLIRTFAMLLFMAFGVSAAFAAQGEGSPVSYFVVVQELELQPAKLPPTARAPPTNRVVLTNTGSAFAQTDKLRVFYDVANLGDASDIWGSSIATNGGVVKHYGPLNEGPLPEKIASTFRSGTYDEVITTEPTKLYRVYGGSAGEMGAYWTRTKPSGPVQSISDSALLPQWGNNATNVVEVDVPIGTKFYEGVAAPQGGLVGGGNQVFFDTKVDPSWKVSP